MGRRLSRASALLAAAAVAAGVMAACGSSDKPEYCDQTAELKDSVNKLKDDATSLNVTALQGDVAGIETNVNDVVDSAQQDFPTETDALSSSATALKDSLDDLGSSPSAQDLLALAPQVAAAVSAAQKFEDATSDKC